MEKRIWHAAYDENTPIDPDVERIDLARQFQRTVEKFGNRPAVHFMNRSMNYLELDDHVGRFAAALQDLGVTKGTKVAVHLPNLPQTIIAITATLRLGGQVVMTNPLYVGPEIEHQWHDADCEVAVTMDYLYDQVLREVRDRLPIRHYIVASIPEYLRFPLKQLAPLKLKRNNPPLVARIGRGEDVLFFSEQINTHRPLKEIADIDFDDLAALQYTGGTTGVAKGAMLSHGNILSNVQQIRAWFPNTVAGQEVLMAALPFFHIFGLTGCMMWAHRIGAGIVLAPNPRDIKSLVKSISKHKVSLFPAVPAMFNAINMYPGIERVDMSSIKSCFSGSAPLPVEVLQRFEELTDCRIVEGFGLTESSPITHGNPMRGVRKMGSIGTPFPGTDARIVDVATGRTEMEPGEEGELIIKGPQVMQGYWNRPDETALALRDGWLFTGDLAAMDDEGYFVIVGRKKDMIIASGYNIYPDEIDRQLMAHPKVMEACTIGIPDPKRGETIKSFVVLNEDEEATGEELRAYLLDNLARYKVPRLYEFRSTLPKSSMMKLLRRELRDEELNAISGRKSKKKKR